MAPTASQVIESGEYLEPDFNPSSLTIPILLAIFIHHNIAYPSPHTKAVLIKLFNEKLKPRAGEFKKQREKEKRMQASSQDVFDGVTGARVPAVEPTTRRSTRRSSKTPEYVPEPPKPRRGRGSSTPSSSTARSTRGHPEVIEPKLEVYDEEEQEEEEEEEEEIEEEPQPQPPKRRAAAKPRQSDGNDSAWETNNPFQSGPSDRESLTPSRQQKPKAKPATRNRNPATAPRISDLSSSPDRPPQRFPASRSLKARDEAVNYMQPTRQEVEEEEEEEEDVDDDVVDEGYSRVTDFSGEIELVPLNDTPDYRRRMAELRQRSPGAYPEGEEEEEEEEGEGEEDEEVVEDDDDEPVETTAAQLNTRVSKKLAEVQRTPKRKSRGSASRSPPAPKSWYSFTWFKFVAFIVISATSAVFSAYKRDSAYIGFCDHGSDSNLRIHELRAQRQKHQIEAARCYSKLNFTSVDAILNNEFCSPVPLHNPLEADTCTPCPKFAFCTPDSVTCQSSYILKPHPLAALGPALNGFPGLGSVAFPPKCVQDREKLKRIGGLVDGIESWLAMTRGTRICNGAKAPTDERDGGEAKVLGLEKESLREAVKRKTKRDAENADDIFERVLADLDKFGMIIKGTDVEGFEYVAAVRADFTLPCRIKVTAREWWEANRRRVYTFLVLMAGLFYLRSRALASAAESRKVAGLVQEALDMLQEQEFGYHADPVTTTEPYIIPVHLRDLILKDEHSPQVRQRVWQKVAKIVEGNANVRTNEEEVRGEYTKVWRWVGSVGTPARSRRVSFADRSMRSLIDDDEE